MSGGLLLAVLTPSVEPASAEVDEAARDGGGEVVDLRPLASVLKAPMSKAAEDLRAGPLPFSLSWLGAAIIE
jgi:hypothetical protein